MSHIINKSLFTIQQAAKASGLSRATLLKLEKAGFLVPARVNRETGYRYYDPLSISKLQQYRMMRELALPQRQIFAYYRRDLNPEELLDYLTTRIHLMQRFRDELLLRHSAENNYHISEITLPACTAYCRTDLVDSTRDTYAFALNVYHEAIDKNLEVAYHELPFTVRSDTETAGRENMFTPYELTFCIPVSPKHIGQPDVEFYPKTRALSILHYGSLEEYDRMWKLLWDEFRRRGLTPDGKGRGICVLFPNIEPDLTFDKLTARFTIPIRDTGPSV